MNALVLTTGSASLRLVHRPEPTIKDADDIKVRVLQTGICGTDREEASGGRALSPNGSKELVLGHEMFGRVVEIGKAVTRVRSGDYAVFTVRRGCGICLPCEMNRPDMCRTGHYRERGIWGQDGFDAEYVVDKEQYIVQVPPEIRSVGVLTEPASVVEKAIDEAVRVQLARLPGAGATPRWLSGRRCLVAGLGPVGLLASMILSLRGAEVLGVDVVDEHSPRAQWLAAVGGRYIDGRKLRTGHITDQFGPIDLILEAAGIPALDFDLLGSLAINGVYVLTGIPGGKRPLEVDGGSLLRTLVLKNQLMFGSVNASTVHYQMAIADLVSAQLRWGALVQQLITHRHRPQDLSPVFLVHPSDEIKAVIEWNGTV